jgi:DNA repair protein RadA/Sms
MSSKASSTIYVCENCGNEQLQWAGRCPMCGEWNTLREVRGLKASSKSSNRSASALSSAEIQPIASVPSIREARTSTGIAEFDRTLGGGIVAGSVILIGGEPGIGKSTLLMQLAGHLPGILYISGEESASQIKLRAERLGIETGVDLMIETDVTTIADTILTNKPTLAIVDSIQTLYDPQFPSTPGSIVQVRESALRIQQTAKQSQVPIVIVGHVTKEGAVAGPRTLEHLVDVVLYLEGERHHGARILRIVKNRFGATDEVGIFEMRNEGLIGVDNPSGFLLAERRTDSPGSVVGVTLEGTRPLLVEIQALTVASGFGYPKRTASGFDLNRLNLLIAVLQKRAGLNLASSDVYINIVGGLQLREPALDLAVAMSIVSAHRNKAVPNDLALFGELGLSGEIRSTQQAQARTKEATRLGYPRTVSAKSVSEAINQIFGRAKGESDA